MPGLALLAEQEASAAGWKNSLADFFREDDKPKRRRAAKDAAGRASLWQHGVEALSCSVVPWCLSIPPLHVNV